MLQFAYFIPNKNLFVHLENGVPIRIPSDILYEATKIHVF